MGLIKIIFFKWVIASLKYRSLKAVIICIDLSGMSFSSRHRIPPQLDNVERVRYRRNRAIFSRVASKDKEMNRQARARITKRTSVLRFFCSIRRRTDSFLNDETNDETTWRKKKRMSENVRSCVVVINRSATAFNSN